MFKTIITLAVIALVSNTDAAKLTMKNGASIKNKVTAKHSLHNDRRLAQLKSKAHHKAMLKNKNKQEEDDDLPESITLEEADEMIKMVDWDASGDVEVHELEKACVVFKFDKEECEFIVSTVEYCDADESNSVDAAELQSCVNAILAEDE